MVNHLETILETWEVRQKNAKILAFFLAKQCVSGPF
jgi:hypothetical protein